MVVVGEACHRFFACDGSAHSPAMRLERATRLLRQWGAPQLAPGDLVTASDRLQAFLAERYGGGRVLREWPVHAVAGDQLIGGRIDLLVDIGDSFALLDHKSFPGTIELDEERLRAFAGQTSLYARAIEAVTGKPCREVWLHQPIAGSITEVILA
jgi:ATP-dependent helicase/nuclease subunit A